MKLKILKSKIELEIAFKKQLLDKGNFLVSERRSLEYDIHHKEVKLSKTLILLTFYSEQKLLDFEKQMLI